MYPELENIDYVFYFDNKNQLHMVDISDRETTTENTGEPRYKDAYENCLIALNDQKSTEKLYLVRKRTLDSASASRIFLRGTGEEKKAFLEKHADEIIQRKE